MPSSGGEGREVAAPSVPCTRCPEPTVWSVPGSPRCAQLPVGGHTHPCPRRRSSFTRLQTPASRRVSQDFLPKSKENLGCRARGIRVSKQRFRKNESAGFGDFSLLERSSACLLVCKVDDPLDPFSGSRMLSLPWTAGSQ